MKKLHLFIILFLFQGFTFSQTISVSSFLKISATEGGFTGNLQAGDYFGSCKVIGDLDNDGFEDLAVGARYDSDGGFQRGAVWILFLNADRTVKASQKISDIEGNFTGILDDQDWFGCSVAALGDVNNDGYVDIGVGAHGDDDGASNSGAEWILFLDKDGTVKSHQKISATQGGLVGLTENRVFGISSCGLGDLNNDSIPDIAVGTPNYDNDGGVYRGCVWILFLNANGTVQSQQKISENHGNLNLTFENFDKFGFGLSNLGDVNGDSIIDIAVGAIGDDDGGTDIGAVYILFLDTNGTVIQNQKISVTQGGFAGTIEIGSTFGYGTTGIGDIDGDGVNDMIISDHLDNDGGAQKGAVWVILLNNNGTVKAQQKISSLAGNFTGFLDNTDVFGRHLSHFSDGNNEIVAGANLDDDGVTDAGAVWILDIDYLMSIDNVNTSTITIYPNPASDYIYIEANNQISTKANYQIIDLSGKVIISSDFLNIIKINNINEGMYLLKIITESKVFTEKIFIIDK